MTCPICKRLYCDHSPAERGQSFDEMIEDMHAPHIIIDEGLTKRVTQSEYEAYINRPKRNDQRIIRKMELPDIKEVKEIQDSYSYCKMSSGQAQKNGFFMRLLDEEEFTKSIVDPSSCNFVYSVREKIEGYIMASFRNHATADERIKRASYFDTSLQDQILKEKHLFAQYVAKRKHSSCKIVLSLEQEMFNEAVDIGCKHIVGLIALSPDNRTSWDFHKGKGWKKIGRVSDKINELQIEWGVVYRSPQELL
ncbi:MAG: hypothetical protein AABY00_01740 [Nanoarchaeota archaeon]